MSAVFELLGLLVYLLVALVFAGMVPNGLIAAKGGVWSWRTGWIVSSVSLVVYAAMAVAAVRYG